MLMSFSGLIFNVVI